MPVTRTRRHAVSRDVRHTDRAGDRVHANGRSTLAGGRPTLAALTRSPHHGPTAVSLERPQGKRPSVLDAVSDDEHGGGAAREDVASYRAKEQPRESRPAP